MLDLARTVIADGVITDAEAEALQRWVEHNPDMMGVWPADDLIRTLGRFLSDGYLDKDERAELFEMLVDMTGELSRSHLRQANARWSNDLPGRRWGGRRDHI